MRPPDRDGARMLAYRTSTEERLSALLIRAGRPTTLDRIRVIIFDKGHTQLSAYVTEMLQIFQSSKILKSPSFCSRSQAENPHILRVLALGDEFRERIAFCGSQEKIGKCLAQRVCHDKF